MTRNYICIYPSYLELCKGYKAPEIGRLFYGALQYARTGEEPLLKGRERQLWPIIKADIDNDDEIYEGRKIYGCVGKYHPNWKGGITPENQRGRRSPLYRQWRTAVFERDQYTCQKCGQFGGALNAHHIKPWAQYQESRYDVGNGVTLCEHCHKKIHGR